MTIGGADVRALPAAQIMAMTSMVFQDVYLFDTTIWENLRIARPGATNALWNWCDFIINCTICWEKNFRSTALDFNKTISITAI